jgi:hypothetical protein
MPAKRQAIQASRCPDLQERPRHAAQVTPSDVSGGAVAMTSWSTKSRVTVISMALEGAGFILLLGASSTSVRLVGGLFLALGVLPWLGPAIVGAIGNERERVLRETDDRASEKHLASGGGVEQMDAADEARRSAGVSQKPRS